MDNRAQISETLLELDRLSPAGFAIALHVKFTAPRFLFQTYPTRWTEIYSERGLVMSDPTVQWSFENLGAIRWRDLAAADTAGVLQMAAAYGMAYGVTLALSRGGSRTLASFSRTDRDYLDAEIDTLSGALEALHNETMAVSEFSDAVHADLKQMSIRLTHS